MQYWDSNSRPLGYESPALTTRPRLSPISNVSFNACLYACPQQVLLSETETGNLESHSSSSSPSAFKSLFAFAFSLQRRSLQVKRDRGWTSVLRGASLSAHSRDKNLLRIPRLERSKLLLFYSCTTISIQHSTSTSTSFRNWGKATISIYQNGELKMTLFTSTYLAISICEIWPIIFQVGNKRYSKIVYYLL